MKREKISKLEVLPIFWKSIHGRSCANVETNAIRCSLMSCTRIHPGYLKEYH